MDDADLQDLCFVRTAHDVDMGSSSWSEAASASLAHNGFCVLRPGVSQAHLFASCASDAMARCERLLTLVESRGIDPVAEPFTFKEVCKRHGGRRYDLDMPCDTGEWAELRTRVEAIVRRVIPDASVDRAGAVVSYPGTPAQNFHCDGPNPGLFTAMVPLVAVDASNGTDVCPGTHVARDFAGGEIPWQDATQMEPLAPSLAPGEILLFDYRLKHRGRANTTAAARPLGYFVFSRPGLSDAVNFAHASLEADVAPHLLALARAEAARAAGTGGNPIFHTLLLQKPYDSAHLSLRMRQPDDWEALATRHEQRDPTKGCIDPTQIGAARDVCEITLRLPDGPRTLEMFAYLSHLVNPDTLWDPEADSSLPIYEGGTWTGTLLWDSAVHATEWLLASTATRDRLRGKSALELGCGLGLPGLACHALGASPVLLTDRPPIAALVAEGLEHAGLADGGVRAYSFEWDDAGAAAVLAEFGGRPPDFILACDCIFAPLFGDSFLLLRMLDALAGPHTTAIVALERRADDGAERFFEEAIAAGFAVSAPRVECGAVVCVELTRS